MVKKLPIYDEQRRFLPLMSKGSGARVSEIVVNHRSRRFGYSKYGLGRALRVALDLISIKFLTQFSQRPLHYFGLLSLFFLLAGLSFAGLGLFHFSAGAGDPGAQLEGMFNEWQQVIVTILLLVFMLVVYFALLGLLAELAVRASGMHSRSTLNRILNELH